MAQNSFLLGEDGIFRITCVGDQDKASAREMAEETLQILIQYSGRLKVLFDATEAGKFSVEARQEAATFLAQARRGKAAIVGSYASMQALELFMTCDASDDGLRLFHSQKEALKWLSKNAGHERRAISFHSLWRALCKVGWLRRNVGSRRMPLNAK